MQIEISKEQKKILEKFLTTDIREMLVVGGIASGKTTLGALITLYMMRLGNTISLITRETEREIINTILPRIFSLANEYEFKFMQENWDKHLQRIIHPTGSILLYMSVGDLKDQYRRLAGYEFNFVLIDEASEISEAAYIEITQKRLRRPPFQKALLLSNPTSTSHWLFKRFAGKEYRLSTFSNPFIDEEFKKSIQNWSKEEIKVRAEGYWGMDFKSDVYSAFSFEENIFKVKNEDEMKDYVLNWYILSQNSSMHRMIGSIDWGVERMAVVLGYFNELEETLYLFDEYEFSYVDLKDIIDFLWKNLKEKWKIRMDVIQWIGDIGGKHTSWNLRNAFDIFREKGIFVRLVNPKLLDSVQLEQRMIARRKIKIWEKCERIINSYFTAYKIENNEVKKVSELEHIKDAVRYLVYDCFKTTKLTFIQKQ